MTTRAFEDAARLRALLRTCYAGECLSPQARSNLVLRLRQAAGSAPDKRWTAKPLAAWRRRPAVLAATAAVGVCLVAWGLWAGLIGGVVPGGEIVVEPPGGGGTVVAPRLEHGTIEQGAQAAGYAAPIPAWLPQGASLESVSWPVPGEGAEIWLSLGYRVTGRGFAVHKRPAEGRWREVTAEEASAHVKVRGYPTEHRQTSPEPGDEVSSTWNSVRWVEDAWCYVVEGDVELEVLLQIAESVGREAK